MPNVTPAQFAKTFTAGFAHALRAAVGDKKRVTLDDVKKVAPLFADNVKGYLEHTGQKSVSLEKLIASGHDYAYANFEKGVRHLPADLADNWLAIRGGRSHGKALPVAQLRDIARDFENLDAVGNIDDRVATEVKSYTRAKDVDDVKAAVEKSITTGGFWNVDGWTDSGKKGVAAVSEFVSQAVDGITAMAGEAGDDTAPIQQIADRLTAALKDGTFKSAQLLNLDVYGPQIEDTRAVLVLTGADGKLASISADKIDF